MQAENKNIFRHELLQNNLKLAATCTLIGFQAALVSACYTYYLVLTHPSYYTPLQYHAPLLCTIALLFGTTWLLVRNSRYKHNAPMQENDRRGRLAIYCYMLLVLLTDIILAFITRDTVGALLFTCWYIMTIVTLPYFHVLKKRTHILFSVLLQICAFVMLYYALPEAYNTLIVPVLIFTSGIIAIIHLLSYRILHYNTRQFIASDTTRKTYIDYQLRLHEENQSINRMVHDLRNPIASIQLLAQFTQKNSIDNAEECTENLNIILECCRQINLLLDDIITRAQQEVSTHNMIEN